MTDPNSFEDMMSSFTNVLQPGGAALPRCSEGKQLSIDEEVRKVTLGLLKEEVLSDAQVKLLSTCLNYITAIRY